jgi:hypothetical protein
MSGAPIKKLPASPRVGSPSVPVADRSGEEINLGFGDFWAGRSNQLRDPQANAGIIAATGCQSDKFPRRCFEAVQEVSRRNALQGCLNVFAYPARRFNPGFSVDS